VKIKKKVLFSIAVCIGVLVAGGIIAAAYFTSLDEKQNDIRLPHNTIEISEEYDPPEQSLGENVFKKDASIKNTGESPCWVRVYADFSNSFVRSRSYISDGTNHESLVFYSAEHLINEEDDQTTFVEHINAGEDWIFIPENSSSVLAGYYYYKKPLAVGESTPSLFTYIKTVNSTEDDIDQYEILVYAESMQLTDIDGNRYANYEEAWTDYLSK